MIRPWRSYSLFLDSRIVFLSFLVNCFGKGLVKRALSWWRTWQRNRRRRIEKSLTTNLPYYAGGLVSIYVLKRFYSAAGADDLLWILQPLAFLVELITGIHFQYDHAAGFVSLASRVIIAPACAGVNFLIICFATLLFPFVSRIGTTRWKWAWFAISIAAAYLITLWANSARIIASIWLYGAPIYGEWVTPDRVHRLAGTLLYVPVLVVMYLVAERLVTAGRVPGLVVAGKTEGKATYSSRILVVPLVWYLTITVFIPFLNGAFHRQGNTYLEHTFFVLAATCLIFLLWLLPGMVKKTVDFFRQTKEKRARQGMQQCILKSQRERLHEAADYDR